MSEDRKNTSAAETDKDPSTVAVDATGAIDADESPASNGQGKIALSIEKANPVVLLLFMILIMVIILATISLRGKGPSKPGVGSDDPVMAALKADLDARRSELNRQRMAMGLPPLEGSSEPIEDIATRVKSDTDTLVGLAGRFQQMLADKDAEISSRNSEVLRLEKLRQDVSMENSRLQSELNRALLAATELEQLKISIESLQSQRDALSMELSDTRMKLAEAAGSVDEDDYADLQRRYDEAIRSKAFFENRVNELEALLSKAELFAKSENELLPAARELFGRLRKLEGTKASDLNTEYDKLVVDLGASVMHTLDFETGSSELSPEDMTQLTNIADSDEPDGSFVLIVGYASKTGDMVTNERLSSDRATTAAEFFATRKRDGQKVQAVYLGQTDRFSSEIPERNQICEVWRIRKE